MPTASNFKTVVLHKANGTTITYNRVTEVLSQSKDSIVFTDEKFGRVSSCLPWQIKFNPLAINEERTQA